jgi:AraC-like DNA-binding protein
VLLGVFSLPLTGLCSTHAVWFWLFSTALFSDSARLRPVHVACLAAMAIAGAGVQLTSDDGPTSTGMQTLALVFSVAWLGFAFLAPLAVMQGMSVDLDQRRRRIRRWFVPGVAAYLTLVAVVQGLRVLQDQGTPTWAVLVNLMIIDAIACAALASFVRVRVDHWLAVVDPPAPATLSRVEQHALDVLQRRFVSERLYARDGLGIKALAELLGTQEHVLRRVINRALGYRNFNDFLHQHRLREATIRLRDPRLRRVPVLTIALEAGYGSIGPFNRAFRDRYGMTPGEYRRESTDAQRVAPEEQPEATRS